MDELVEVVENIDEVEFLVSLDYSSNEADLYSCSEWADLYIELGDYDNNPLILDGDSDHHIWNMFAGSTYSAYALLDHNMWADLYIELGNYDNNPLILDSDLDHHIWNMFAGSTYSAYALLDHNMILRYKFDMPNLYDFQYTYIPLLIDAMYGCTDSNACNHNIGTVYDDGSCQYNDECYTCSDASNQMMMGLVNIMMNVTPVLMLQIN